MNCRQYISKLVDIYRKESTLQNHLKIDIMDYLSCHLNEVDKIFTGYMYKCQCKDANKFKSMSIEFYTKAWKQRFRLIKLNDFIEDLTNNPQFPPAFDTIVDDYIEQETGKRPNISAESLFKPVEKSFVDPLRRFREDD